MENQYYLHLVAEIAFKLQNFCFADTTTSKNAATLSTTQSTPPPTTTKKYIPPPFTGLNVLGSNTFELVNPYRANSFLKFSITGVNVTAVKHSKASFGWQLSLFNFEEQIRIYRYDSYRKDHTDYAFHWEMDVEDLDDLPDSVEVCFHYGHNNASWYSTYEQRRQSWPMDTGYKTSQSSPTSGFHQNPFQTGDLLHSDFGGLIEYLFLTSDGFAVLLSDREPLKLRRDPNGSDPLLCASIDRKFRFTFKFNVLATANLRSTYTNITTGHTYLKLKSPKAVPDERLFKEPVWSTKVAFKEKAINQSAVVEFAKQIKQHAFPASQVEIDGDQWEGHYGDLTFDPTRFPNPKAMVDSIHALGFKVSLWVHPFVSPDSAIFRLDNRTSRYLAKDKRGRILKVKWWTGNESSAAAIVDFSDDQAVGWFVRRLQALKNATGVDTFSFDGGERGVRRATWRMWQPKLGNAVQVAVGYKSQDVGVFVRLGRRASTWDGDNGLQSVIPSVLTFSLAGYPFLLGDVIGGNGGGGSGNVSEELFIRWLQVNTFLPAMQLSTPPWSFGAAAANSSTLKLAKKFIDLHVAHSATIIGQAKKLVSSEGREPLLIRPLWWAAPEDPASWRWPISSLSAMIFWWRRWWVRDSESGPSTFHPVRGLMNRGRSSRGREVLKVLAPLEVLPYFRRSVAKF
ncbi:hypothetical protein TYRP_005383 [Tyrophagus putrescentiae]|nr:hypothetical protein TYRP_005383 [Tyrophagus putrescentiae]